MANFSQAFSPSFNTNTFTTTEIPGIDYKSGSKLNLSNINFNRANSLTFNPIAFDPSVNLMETGWSFITAPEDVSWDVSNQANRVDIFGTNNPPVVAGSRGMRDLTLGNSLVEGFIRGVTVEGKIAALENLMNYTLNQRDGFVGVPVYQVTANDKVYGNGYFIIKDVKVKESMRDLRGNATRAYVDISLMEVPAYQVNSGRDLASQPAAAAKALALTQTSGSTTASGAATTGARTGATAGTLGAGQSAAKAGPTAASPAPSKSPSQGALPSAGLRYRAQP
jgi:hypothetical protein